MNSLRLFEVSVALKVSLFFLNKQMYSFFQEFFDQGFALVDFDDILLLAHTKTHILGFI